MRMWQDDKGRLYTDEQLLRHIAHFGSIEKALDVGDIHVINKTIDSSKPYANSVKSKPMLKDLLREN